MPRAMTTTTPLDPAALLDGPKTRTELGVTPYAITLAKKSELIERAKDTTGTAYLWKLTAKGRRQAKRRR